MIEEIREKASRYLFDKYLQFGDYQVSIDEDGMGFSVTEFGFDDNMMVDTHIITSKTIVRISNNGGIIQQTDEYPLHAQVTIIYESWNDFINYDRCKASFLDSLYMDWDSYKLS